MPESKRKQTAADREFLALNSNQLRLVTAWTRNYNSVKAKASPPDGKPPCKEAVAQKLFWDSLKNKAFRFAHHEKNPEVASRNWLDFRKHMAAIELWLPEQGHKNVSLHPTKAWQHGAAGDGDGAYCVSFIPKGKRKAVELFITKSRIETWWKSITGRDIVRYEQVANLDSAVAKSSIALDAIPGL